MYNVPQKFLIFGNFLTLFFGLQTLGVLTDEQIITMSWYNNLLTSMVILSIPFILNYYKKYFCIGFYALASIVVGIGSLYYDHILLLERGFVAFGLVIPTMLILGGGASLITILYICKKKFYSK